MDSLFDPQAPTDKSATTPTLKPSAPLAVRMRPQNLDEVLGQQHVLGPGAPLRRLIEGDGDSSIILYGPPGTGKTTLAGLVSQATGRRFTALSALNAGVKEVREVISEAQRQLSYGRRTVLFIDEVHRFSRTQQDALLSAVENRTVLLVAATTENPSFSVVGPLLSRSLLLQLQPLGEADLRTLLSRACTDPRGVSAGRQVQARGSVVDFSLSDEALTSIVALAGGDARRALTYLESAADSAWVGFDSQSLTPTSGSNRSANHVVITDDDVKRSVDRALVRYDRQGDQHYDVISAYIKSIRGSDPDAALHYLARMIEAGEDPRFIARRLVIHASEDIGMADPTALLAAQAAAQAVATIGLPEARLTLAQATVHLATAPKSNAIIRAIDSALADVRAGKIGTIPAHLRDGHYAGAKKLGNAQGYKYPHDDPRGVLAQNYRPEPVKNARYYEPSTHGAEKMIATRLAVLRKIIASEQ